MRTRVHNIEPKTRCQNVNPEGFFVALRRFPLIAEPVGVDASVAAAVGSVDGDVVEKD